MKHSDQAQRLGRTNSLINGANLLINRDRRSCRISAASGSTQSLNALALSPSVSLSLSLSQAFTSDAQNTSQKKKLNFARVAENHVINATWTNHVLRSKLASRANRVANVAAAAASADLISAGGAGAAEAASAPLAAAVLPSALALEAAPATSPDAADAAPVSEEAKAKSEFIDEGRASDKLSGVSVAMSGTSVAQSSSASAR
jgi:hypothetical protein